MDSEHASEHLQVIRTLMERVAVYRRALAPIMLSIGAIGTLAAALGAFTAHFQTNRAFAALWSSTAIVAVVLSYLLVRRQALKEDEAFWSPPTRRVTQALVPGFLTGAMTGVLGCIGGDLFPPIAWLLAVAWLLAYGSALHAAGFFMERGIKLFGMACVACGVVLLMLFSFAPPFQNSRAAHLVMGFFFGILHLAYGGYLRWTERAKA